MKLKNKTKDALGWYLMMMIPILGTFLFSVVPLFNTVTGSIQNSAGNFVGTTNYSILFDNNEFRQGVGNTFYMGILALLFNIPISFSFANILNNIVKGKSFFKTIFLLPIIMSMITVALMFKFLFSADPNSLANTVVQLLGFEKMGWFNDPATARETVVLMNLWKNIGYNTILFFAGLQNIPQEHYEAAYIDGAGTFQQWIHITIPSMRNTFIFVYITMCINVLKRFSDVFAISGEFGEPAGSLHTIMSFIYKNSFSTRFSKDLGAAASASIVMFVLIAIITLLNTIITNDENLSLKIKKLLKGLKNEKARS